MIPFREILRDLAVAVEPVYEKYLRDIPEEMQVKVLYGKISKLDALITLTDLAVLEVLKGKHEASIEIKHALAHLDKDWES